MTPETKFRELERRAMARLTRPLEAPELVDMVHASVIVVERLGELTVPSLLASHGIGIDGIVNGIETQHGQVHVEWWCNGPPARRVLTEEVERLRLDLDALKD